MHEFSSFTARLVSICFRVIVFPVLTADMCGLDFIHQDELPFLSIIQLYGSPAIATIPQAVVMSASVRRFIVDQQHILLQAVHLRLHGGADIFLPHMPDDFFIVFLKRECGFHHQVKLGKVEIILLTSADWNNVFHMSKTVYGNDLRRALNLGLVQKVAAGKGGNHCIYELCQNIEPDIRADSLTLSQRKNLTDMFAEFHGRQFSVEECGKLLGISNPTAAFHLKNFAERGLLEEHRRPGKAYNYSFRVKPDENPECFVVTGHTDYIGRAGTQSQIRGGSVAVAG